MTKPEDIPNEAVIRAMEVCDSHVSFEHAYLAAIANVLIEAGVVSPPCYCGRKAFGGVAVGPIIEHEGIPILWAPGANPQNVVTEHWKGQAE